MSKPRTVAVIGCGIGHERFEVKRINHQEAYSLDGACTNQAEEYSFRPCRAEIGFQSDCWRVSRYARES